MMVYFVRIKKIFLGTVILLVLISGLGILVTQSQIISSRFLYLMHAWNDPPDVTSSESNTVRLLIWKVDRELIAEENIFGYGTGDVHMELDARYKTHGMTGALSKHLNAHNQFFQTGIAIGFPGMILLAMIFILPLKSAFRKRKVLFLFMLLLFLLNICVESMLETEAGVIFFSLFYCFLFTDTVEA